MGLPKFELLPSREPLLLLTHQPEPKTPLQLRLRMLAHFFDWGVVFGIGNGLASFFTFGFLALLSPQIEAVGSEAGENLFSDVFDYAQPALLAGSLVFVSILYFVVLPALTGKTLGLGMMGLKIKSQNGADADLESLMKRFVGCSLLYATGGMWLLDSFRRSAHGLPHDRYSQTKVVKD